MRKHEVTSHIVNPIDRDLEYFMICAELKSVSKASEKLGIQQAGLSKVLLKLEGQIGHKLFARSNRGLELTDYGKGLFRTLQQTKVFWGENYRTNFDGLNVSIGSVKIGCHPSIAAHSFGRLYPAILSRFPSLQIECEFATSLEVTRRVSDLSLDVGLVINPVKTSNLVARVLSQEFVAVWGAREENSGTIIYNPEMYMAQKVVSRFAGQRILAVPNYEVIAEMARQTGYLGILPNTSAERHELKQVGQILFGTKVSLIYHKDKFQSQIKSELIQEMVKALKA